MFNEYTFLVFMALIAVLYFLLRLVYQKGTIRNKCPSCNVKLKRKVVQNGIDKFGLVLKPFKCPACHASIIFEKEPYDLFLGAMIFGCILAFIAFEKGSEITSTVVIAFIIFGLAKIKVIKHGG
jgi:hypothetical protein